MRSRAFTFLDLLASLVVFVLLFGVFVVAAEQSSETQNRVQCASNLKTISQALLLYANENRGAYPRTQYDAANPVPTWGTPYEADQKLGPVQGANPFAKADSELAHLRPMPNDVTAAMFLLLRTQQLFSGVFVCPSTSQKRWDFGGRNHTPLDWTNWQGNAGIRDHLSYSYQNPYPSRQAVAAGFKLNNAISAEFAVMADMNPGTDTLLKLTSASQAAEMRDGNSLNHGRDGQNVLFGDGHVEFYPTPFCGVKRDNIYTYGPSGTVHKDTGGDGIVGPSTGPNDSILLPTARDIGLLDEQKKPNP